MMPNMTGIAFFEELVQTRPDCVPSVVFMTGGTTTKAISDFLATVKNGNLVKPFELEQLTRAVQAVLFRSRLDAPPRAGA